MARRLRLWLAGATGLVLALIPPTTASAQEVEYGEGAVSLRMDNGDAFAFPYYNLPPPLGGGAPYLAASRIMFETNLNLMRGDQGFRARLTRERRRILDAVSVDVLNVHHAVFASSLSDDDDEGSVIKVSAGSAAFVESFTYVMSLFLERLPDDMMVALFLESEQGVGLGKRRWFQPHVYFTHLGRGVLFSPPSPTSWGQIYLNGQLLVRTALMHELCHLFLGHGPIQTPTLALLRQRELDADRCAIDYLAQEGVDPELGLTFALAVAVIGDPANASHPASAERWAAAREAGEEFVAAAVEDGRMSVPDSHTYRTNLRRVQNAIEFAAQRSARTANEEEPVDPDVGNEESETTTDQSISS